MREELKKILVNAYSPYYKFRVAAIVVTKDNKAFRGVNVENANGTSICAERNAIASAVSYGYRKGDFKEIYMMFDQNKLGTPCFACRQVLLEFFDKDTKIICMNDKEEKTYTLEELCPFPFGSDDLK